MPFTHISPGRAYAVLYAAAGGGGELHLHRAAEDADARRLRGSELPTPPQGAAVGWVDAPNAELAVDGGGHRAVLRAPPSWHAALRDAAGGGPVVDGE
eukprot:gene10099-61071_t